MLSNAANSLRPNASTGTCLEDGKTATVLRLMLLLLGDSVGRSRVEEYTSLRTRDAIIRSNLRSYQFYELNSYVLITH